MPTPEPHVPRHRHDHDHDHDTGHDTNADHVVDRQELHRVVARRLERDGQRYTSGRRRVVELLASRGHPMTMPEILAAESSLAQSSVYCTLAVLERAGVVTRVITNGEWSCVELAEDLTGHHHHLVCESCGAVRDVEVPDAVEAVLDEALMALAAAEGFTLDRHRLDLVGRCSSCR